MTSWTITKDAFGIPHATLAPDNREPITKTIPERRAYLAEQFRAGHITWDELCVAQDRLNKR